MVKALGKNFCVCRDEGTFDSPSFVPLIGAKDIKINAKPSAMIDSTDREQAETVIDHSEIPTRMNVEVSFNAIWNGGAGLSAIRDAFLLGTPIRLAALSALPGNGGVGLFGDWLVTKFPIKFPLTDGQLLDLSFMPHGNGEDRVTTYTDSTGGPGTAETKVAKKIGTNGSVNDFENNPITAAKDFSLNCEWETMDGKDRGSLFDMVIPTKRKISAELEFIWDADNEQLVAFTDAFHSGEPIPLTLLDGPYTTGSWGVAAEWAITDYPLEANLTDGQIYKVKLVPHGNATTPLTFLTI